MLDNPSPPKKERIPSSLANPKSPSVFNFMPQRFQFLFKCCFKCFSLKVTKEGYQLLHTFDEVMENVKSQRLHLAAREEESVTPNLLAKKVKKLMEELKEIQSQSTTEQQSDITEQQRQYEQQNRTLQSFDTRLLCLIGEAGQSSNLQKQDNPQLINILYMCALILHTQHSDLANRIVHLESQYDQATEIQQRKFKNLKTSQSGIAKKIKGIEVILENLMQDAGVCTPLFC